METLDRALVRAAGFPGTGLRFVDAKERERFLEWSELHERARAVAASLRELGLEHGERVTLVFPTSPEFFDAFFGTILAGGVPAPVYPPVRLGRLEDYHARTARMIQVASSRVVLADRKVHKLLGESVARAKPALGCFTLDRLPKGSAPPVDVAPTDLGLVQFSSGSTVDPKPVALSHRAIAAQVELLNGFWPDTPELKHSGVSWLPLYHDMGLIGCVFPALERPAVLTLIGPEVFVTRPAVWLRALSRHRATIATAPNFAYGLCLKRVRDDEVEGIDLDAWRVALCGAEPVAPSVLRGFAERFARYGFRREALTPVYGLAEAALAVTFSALDRPFPSRRFATDALAEERRAVDDPDGHELVSLGRPLPGFALRIVDDDGNDLDERQVGRVLVSGPSLMDGYLDQPELTARVLVDGWLDTGDRGFLVEGELYLAGRLKDLLIVRGRNHASEELEHAVDDVPGYRTGCAVAASWMNDGAERESVALFVERAKEATEADVAALPERCRKAVLGATGVDLDEVVVLEPGTLPRTSSGKIRRQETVRQHQAGELAPPDRVTTFHMLGAMARSRRAFKRYERERDA